MNESITPTEVLTRPRGRGHGRVAAVYLFAALLGSVAWLLYEWRVRSLPVPHAGLSVPWWVIALLSACTELFVVSLQLRRDSYSSSLSEVPLVLGLAFCSPGGLVLARIIGMGASLALHARQVGVKLFFNLAQEALAACTALIVFHAVLGHHPVTSPLG